MNGIRSTPAYRNFSRNVHATDFMQFFALHKQERTTETDDYQDDRDFVTLETAHSMVRGMAIGVADVFGIPRHGLERVPWPHSERIRW
jgi:hypothetical protein